MRWLWLVVAIAACGGEVAVDAPDAGGAAGVDAGRTHGVAHPYGCLVRYDCAFHDYYGSASACCTADEWEALAPPKECDDYGSISGYCGVDPPALCSFGTCTITQGTCRDPCVWTYDVPR